MTAGVNGGRAKLCALRFGPAGTESER
jgi:hypothetical protein